MITFVGMKDKEVSKVVKAKVGKVAKKAPRKKRVAKPKAVAENPIDKAPEWISATDFGKLIPISITAVTKMLDGKLTEGKSYKREGKNNILIHVENAKQELRETIKPSQAKSMALLNFIGLELPGVDDVNSKQADKISIMNVQQVREEQARSELRLSLIEESVQTGKYVEKAVVEKNLESMGIEIKTSFSGFAARITPAVRSAASDREAENLVNKAIEDILFNCSNILERDVASK